MLFFVFSSVTKKKVRKALKKRGSGWWGAIKRTGYGKWPPVELICSQQFSFAIGSNTHFCQWQLIYIRTDMLWRHEGWGNSTHSHTFFPLPIVADDLKVYYTQQRTPMRMPKMNVWCDSMGMKYLAANGTTNTNNSKRIGINKLFPWHLTFMLCVWVGMSVNVTNYDLSNILVSGVCACVCMCASRKAHRSVQNRVCDVRVAS